MSKHTQIKMTGYLYPQLLSQVASINLEWTALWILECCYIKLYSMTDDRLSIPNVACLEAAAINGHEQCDLLVIVVGLQSNGTIIV